MPHMKLIVPLPWDGVPEHGEQLVGCQGGATTWSV